MSREFNTGMGCGYFVGGLFAKAIRLLWNGIVTASKNNKWVRIAYICLFISLFISYAMFGDVSYVLFIIVVMAFICGLIEQAKEYPQKEKNAFFDGIFEEIGLISKDGSFPILEYEQELSEYTVVIAFCTVIPLNIWQSKKAELEMYMHVTISNIRQNKEDNRIIELIIQKKPLENNVAWSDSYIETVYNVLNIGLGYSGMVGMDLEQHSHCFIAGETGSGKSNILKCMIHQALIKDYEVILIDFKRGVSFSDFKDLVTIYYDYPETMQILSDMVKETKSRLDLFRENSVDNIEDYNHVGLDYLYRKIIFIDELAELLKIRDKEISNLLYDSLETLTRLSRAVGIHLIMGIQRPDSTIINGQIKNNVSYRVCGRFADKEPSRIMLNNDMASMLPVIKGRFIIRANECEEIQSFYFKGAEKPYDVDRIKNKYDHGAYLKAVEKVRNQNTKSTPVEEKKETINPYGFDFSDISKS